MSLSLVRLGSKGIGPGAACFVIAEAGSNHNGSLQRAQDLIDLACDAGADAVKFQLFRAQKLYPKSAGVSRYLEDHRSIYEIVAQMELPRPWLPVLAKRCEERNLLFMASVFDEESADLCDPYVKIHKIASYEMTHLPLIQHVARKGKPVVVSTGAASLEEISETVEAFHQTGNGQLILMQCTAAYPAPPETLNLRVLQALQSVFQVPVGLSDHSRHPFLAPVAAVAAGAHLIEKHFTFSNALPGPDHRFAVEPDELKEMVRLIRQAEAALGSGLKELQPVEEELHDFARRSVFSAKAIRAGEVVTGRDLIVLRNGRHSSGAPPRCLPLMLGKRAVRDLECEKPVRWEDLT
ncbi:MAG: N-acetylneuraminate synthase family protein [Candidatus Omnitrophica bacterium]|nr:N-acetylneuraminate synthase family protein [Candidatus Omnitrophota bacterium]